MIFFDTNILIYHSVNQDSQKQKLADKLITSALSNDELLISPLVFTEYVFILAKLKQVDCTIKDIELFSKCIQGEITPIHVISAYELSKTISSCKNINDIVHLKFAEKYCNKLFTFDKDFKRFIPYTKLELFIL